MAISSGTVSFSPTMRIGLFITLLCFIYLNGAFAQTKIVDGIIFDATTKERIAKVKVANITSNTSIYNNLQAQFNIAAQPGEVLVFSKEGYFNDTVKLTSQTSLAVYLKQTAIPLRPVYITGRFLTPKSQLEANRELYSKVYGSIADHDLLSISGAGVGLSIDALYNMLSRQGRNATHLRETIDEAYRQSLIDARFNQSTVSAVTGLKDKELTDFMFKYRPGYYFTTQASDYEFIKYIRNNYRRYKRNPDAYSLAPLYLNNEK
jgi:hypothetical protein